jgi:YD repeat-containing protein
MKPLLQFGLLMIFFFNNNNLHSQTIGFDYDESGNRISRTLITEQLKSGKIDFPVADPKNLNPLDLIPAEGQINAKLYPNPNKGLIKVDVANMPVDPVTELRLYDLSGNQLLIKRNFDSYYEIDISHLKNGIYILRIKINETLFDWKVIKGN